MKTTKHFALAALLVLGAAAPAMAFTSTGPLYPVGDEPNASGNCWLKGNRHGNLSAKVSCSNLTPGESYWAVCWYWGWDEYSGTYQWFGLSIGGFVADSNGNGNAGWASTQQSFAAGPVEVYRHTPFGDQLVLASYQ